MTQEQPIDIIKHHLNLWNIGRLENINKPDEEGYYVILPKSGVSFSDLMDCIFKLTDFKLKIKWCTSTIVFTPTNKE